MANSTLIHLIYKKLLHNLEKHEQLVRENQAKCVYKHVPEEETYKQKERNTTQSLNIYLYVHIGT